MRFRVGAGTIAPMNTQSRAIVLNTRPEGQGARVAAAIDAHAPGRWEIVSNPLLEIRLRPGPLDLAGISSLIFTSANGVRAFARVSPQRGMPALCAGEATTRAARAEGLAAECLGQTARDLEGALRARAPLPGAALWVTGAHIAVDLGASLAQAGPAVRRAVLYDQIALDLAESTKNMAKNGDFSAVLLFSPRTAAIFSKQVQGLKMPDSTALCVISERAAREVAALGLPVKIAPQPTLAGMVALL